MKYLILLILLASCGKHTEPAMEDLNDSDGDGVVNQSDMNKYIAEVTPLEEIEAELKFQMGTTALSSYKFVLSNKVDLQNYSKDLMVKNLELLKLNTFFSEFSLLRIKTDQIIPTVQEGMIRINIKFPHVSSKPEKLHLVLPEGKIDLGNFTETMDLEISSEKLNIILKGEGYLALSHMNGKIPAFNLSQEESIKTKTNRVLVNDGLTTTIHYISKEMDLNMVLKYLKINKYKFITDENLLTTTIKPSMPEWWVREINANEIVIVKENLRALSDHYLTGFTKTTDKLTRNNGTLVKPLVLQKHSSSKILLKIRGDKKLVSFKQKIKTEGFNSPNEFVAKSWTCDFLYNIASAENVSPLTDTELLENLQIIGHNEASKVRSLVDEKGPFWEVEIEDNQEELKILLENLPATSYVQEGMAKAGCVGKDDPKIKPNLHTPERSFNLQIEAFVEKI